MFCVGKKKLDPSEDELLAKQWTLRAKCELLKQEIEAQVKNPDSTIKDDAWKKFENGTAPSRSLIANFVLRTYIKNIYGRQDFDKLIQWAFVVCINDDNLFEDDFDIKNISPKQIAQVIGIENRDEFDQYKIGDLNFFSKKRLIVKFGNGAVKHVQFGNILNRIPLPSTIEEYRTLCFTNNILLPKPEAVVEKSKEIVGSVGSVLSEEESLELDFELVDARKSKVSLGKRKMLLRNEMDAAKLVGNKDLQSNKTKVYGTFDLESQRSSKTFSQTMNIYKNIDEIGLKRKEAKKMVEREESKMEINELNYSSRRPTFVKQIWKDVQTGILKTPEDVELSSKSEYSQAKELDAIEFAKKKREKELRHLRKASRKQIKELDALHTPADVWKDHKRAYKNFKKVLKRKSLELGYVNKKKKKKNKDTKKHME